MCVRVYLAWVHTYVYIYINNIICTIVIGCFTARRGETKKYTLKCTDRFLMVFSFRLDIAFGSHDILFTHCLYWRGGSGEGKYLFIKKNKKIV